MQFEICSEKNFLLLVVHTISGVVGLWDIFNCCSVISSLTDKTPLQKRKAVMVEGKHSETMRNEHPSVTLKLGMLKPGLKDTILFKAMQASQIFIYDLYPSFCEEDKLNS